MKIEYDFLKVGSVVAARPGYIFLDVGNRLEDGIIDTHPDVQEADTSSCSSTLIVDDPSRVTGWVMPSEPEAHIVLHEVPDFDCVASSLLARRLLEAHANGQRPEKWNVWAPVLSATAGRIDQGRTRLGLPTDGSPTLITPYLSLLALHDLASGRGLQKKEAWRWVVEQGHRVLELALELALREQRDDIDCIDLRGKLGDLQALEDRIDARISAFARDAERIGLRSGTPASGTKIDGLHTLRLPDRHDPTRHHDAKMATILDPECGGAFFKSLMRGAFRSEVDATCVFITERRDPVTGSAAWVHPIVSVDPESQFDLRGLGRALEIEELDERVKRSLPRVGPPRPGYDNPDPWYDGRAFGYTIVDAPRWGTVLSPKQVLDTVLGWERWIDLRMQDLMRTAAEDLCSVSTPDAGRAAALKTLLAAARGGIEWDRAGVVHQDHRMAGAVLQLADSMSAADCHLLRDVVARMTPSIIAACTASEDPAVRVWTLNCAATRAADTVSFAETIDRPDLGIAVQIAAATDQELVARLIRGVHVDRLRPSHTLMIDAAASLISRGHDRVAEPLHEFLDASAAIPALRPALVNLGRHASRDTFAEQCARKALASTVADLKMVTSGEDALRREWACLRRTIEECRSIPMLTEAEEAARSELEAVRRAVLTSLHPPAAVWLDALAMPSVTPDQLIALGDAVPDQKLPYPSSLALLSLLADAPGHIRKQAQKGPGEDARDVLLISEAVRVLQALLDVVLAVGDSRRDWHATAAMERCAISDAVRQIVSLTGIESFLSATLRLPPVRLRVLYRGAPWLLERAEAFSRDEARRAGMEIAVSPRGTEMAAAVHQRLLAGPPPESRSNGVDAIKAAQEMVVTRGGASLLHDLFELAKAAAAEYRTPDSAPSYAVPVLAFRLLPIVMQPQPDDGEHLKQARALTMRLATEPLLTMAYRDQVARLMSLIDSDLRHILVYRTILSHFQSALSRLNILLRAADVLRPLGSRSTQCAVKVMEWVVELPHRGGDSALQDILKLRDDIPGTEADTAAVLWCGLSLDIAAECFRVGTLNALTPATLRTALREIRKQRAHRPDSGLALLLSLALDDVVTYLQNWREAFETVEQCEAGEDADGSVDLTTAILAISTEEWIHAELIHAESTRSSDRADRLVDLLRDMQCRTAVLPPQKRARYISKVRHALGDAGHPLQVSPGKEPHSDASTGEVTDSLYLQQRHLLYLDDATAHGLTDRIVQRLLDRYDLKRARRIIENYSLTPPGPLFRAWASAAILAVPILFLILFVAYDLTGNAARTYIRAAIEVALVLTTLSVCITPFAIAARKRARLRKHNKRAGGSLPNAVGRLEERKRTLLFLPKFLVPVLVGVYSVVLTDEVGVKVAAKIHDGPLLLLLTGFAVASALVLGQLIVRAGGEVTASNLVVSGAKIFTYAFLVAAALSIIVAPLIVHEVGEAEKARAEVAREPIEQDGTGHPTPVQIAAESGHVFLHIPNNVETPHFSRIIPAIYPRHIMLYGMLGMFIGIFLHGYLHVKDEKVDPI